MKPDLSMKIYEKYSKLKNKIIVITMRDGRILTGIIIGFFMGLEFTNDNYVTRWHVVKEDHKMSLGIDPFGFLIGDIIDHDEI